MFFEKILILIVEKRLFLTINKSIVKFFKTIRKRIDTLIAIPTIYFLSKNTPIDENKIVFVTTRGQFDCNSKWITLELLKRNLPYTLVWEVRNNLPLDDIPEEIITVKRFSYDLIKHLASAKIIIDNSINLSYLLYKKKKDQILIETWHGSIGIKKFSKDTNNDKEWIKFAEKQGRLTDYCISNSTFEDAVFREDFWKTTPILQLGHARNDILCEDNTKRINDIKEKIYRKFDLNPDTKICLYAPTFRDDGDMSPYRIDYQALIDALKTRFGGDWVIFTRFHFKLLKKIKNYTYSKGVINASDYPDIYELLTCTDVGITDYSSWICDYMLTRKPGFLFATDMTEYEKNDRNFFYPLDTMPYPLALNNQQLIENILNFDNEKFVPACDKFLKDKGCMDDGHASERIVDAICAMINGEQL